MGDVIQVLDEFTIQRCDRHNGKKHIFELCVIYPDYFDHDNEIVVFEDEESMNTVYTQLIEDVIEALYEN
jgi:hypothetical protein